MYIVCNTDVFLRSVFSKQTGFLCQYNYYCDHDSFPFNLANTQLLDLTRTREGVFAVDYYLALSEE